MPNSRPARTLRWPRSRRYRPPGWPTARRRSPGRGAARIPAPGRRGRPAPPVPPSWPPASGKLTKFSRAVSSNCAWSRGPVTRSSGSCGKTSGSLGHGVDVDASCSVRRKSRNAGAKSGLPSLPAQRRPGTPGPPASKRRFSRYSTAVANPAATVKPPPNGCCGRRGGRRPRGRWMPVFQ